MTCGEVRQRLHDFRRSRLAPAGRDAVVHHLEGCAGCRREDEAEALLDRLLHERLPRHAAPAGLRRKLEELVATDATESVPVARRPSEASRFRLRTARYIRVAVPALAAAVSLVAGGVIWGRHTGSPRGDAAAQLAGEAIGDHLRVLAATHPYDVESSASHQVKPWFEGRLDFAPNVPPDTGELRLRGGSVGYFRDRKAAVLSYALRRHAVTLLAVPTPGLDWPEPDASSHGFPARGAALRGIHVIFWRHGDIGYALVADVNPEELWRVAADLYRETSG